MILYSNNASTTLASGISDSATTITVATGTGSLFPVISSVDDYFNVTLTDSAKHIEIVTVTARTGDTFTVMRGMENTTARDWLASDILELRITKGLLDQLKLDATKDTASNLSAHTSNTSNPHSVTATQVGLGNVNNTSDANKPISTATQTALNLKADSSTVSAHTGNTSNPHGTTAAQIGLGNVENKSSATIRGEITSGNVTTALGYTPYNSTNPSGYIAGITSGMVTTALGFTPLSTTGTAADSDTLDGQHGSYYQPASSAITTSNIGSQSVSYASSAGNADTLDGQHGSYYQPASSAITTSNIGSQSVNYATNAGSVAWSGVTSKPTTLAGYGITDAPAVNYTVGASKATNRFYVVESVSWWLRDVGMLYNDGIYYNGGDGSRPYQATGAVYIYSNAGFSAGTYSLSSILSTLVYNSHYHTSLLIYSTNCDCCC